MTRVQVSAGVELIFFLVACTVLWFGIRRRIMLIIRKMERQFLQEHVVTEQGGMLFFPLILFLIPLWGE